MNLSNRRDLTIFLSQLARKRRKALSIPEQVRNILSKYNASLILPGEQTPVLGPELVVNGDFSKGTTGWTPTSGASLSISSGSLRVTQTGSFGSAFQNIPVSPTGVYQITATKTGGNAQNQDVSIGADIASGSSGAYGLANLAAPVSRVVSGLTQGLRIFLQASNISAGEYKDFDNISVREILSYSDTHNGFRTGNYTDSTGTTPATIDGKTGLVIDAAGSVGPELVTGVSASGAWSYSGGVLTATAAAAYSTASIGISAPLQANKAYLFDIEILSVSSGSVRFQPQSGSSSINYSAVGRRTETYIPATTASWINLQAVASGFTGSLIIHSIRELPGIHALQATDGFKPLNRRGLVNLLTYSNSIDTGAWEKKCSNATPVPVVTRNGLGPNGEAAFDVSLSLPGDSEWALVRVNPFALQMKAGEKVTQAVWLKAGAGNAGKKVSIYTYDMTYASYRTILNATLTDQWQLFLVEHTQVGSLSVTGEFAIGKARSSVGGVTNTETATSFCVAQCGLFQGTVTAQQIIDAGGIPVTTDAPKSSSLGPRYWQFDGTDDRLQLSQVPFQMQDDHWVVLACRFNSSGWRHAFCGAGTSVDTKRAALIFRNGDNGKIQAEWVSNTGVTVSTADAVQLGSDTVFSVKKTGNVFSARSNGVHQESKTVSLDSVVLEPGAIGRGLFATNSIGGQIYCVVYGKGAITDAELLLLEKFAGKLAGVQI